MLDNNMFNVTEEELEEKIIFDIGICCYGHNVTRGADYSNDSL